jgi:hypothetical protein
LPQSLTPALSQREREFFSSLLEGTIRTARLARDKPCFKLGRLNYRNGFYGAEEHEGLRLVLRVPITERNVVVGYFNYITFIDATGDAPDIYKLAFVAAE